MAVSQKGRLGRKPTGGIYKVFRGRRKYELGRLPTLTKIGTQKIKTIRTKANHRKMKVYIAQYANILDPKTKKYTKTAIKTVAECPANRHYVRGNIIVKGVIITTDIGRAKITSRPGQDGTVNAILI